MELKLIRYLTDGKATVGRLFIDGQEECKTLEDGYKREKVYGETRIPYGRYKILLRTVGGHHERYLKKFPGLHKGMLWLQDVPNFEYILMHIGNTVDDSMGCVLVGEGVAHDKERDTFMITNSTKAYKEMYGKIVKAFDEGEDVYITIEHYGINHEKEKEL